MRLAFSHIRYYPNFCRIKSHLNYNSGHLLRGILNSLGQLCQNRTSYTYLPQVLSRPLQEENSPAYEGMCPLYSLSHQLLLRTFDLYVSFQIIGFFPYNSSTVMIDDYVSMILCSFFPIALAGTGEKEICNIFSSLLFVFPKHYSLY